MKLLSPKSIYKKVQGFTLIELLAIIVLLSFIITISVSTIRESISTSKDKLYEEQINRIISLSKIWAAENETKLLKKDEAYYLTIEELRASEILNQDIMNPKTNQKMNGCIKIMYNDESDTYDYQYNEENNCP